MLTALKEVQHALTRLLSNRHPSHVRAEGHHLPAELTHIALIGWLIPPATGGGMLGLHRVLYRTFDVRLDAHVTSGCQCFAKHHDAVPYDRYMRAS